ncbi:MAG: DUF4439 domain-containing protein [Nocardioidaceae bacterium]|nr:DUF4439 domain-containing protein [Nocardioidaceae bacterium]
MVVSPRSRVDRRTLLGLGALGVVATATGCRSEGTGAAPAASSSPSTLAAPVETPDRRLVSELYGDLASRTSDLEILRKRRPALRPRIRPLVALHRAHLAVLGTLLGEGSSGWFAGVNGTDLETAEASLAAELAGAVGRAEDGAIARVLASLAAGQAVATRVLDPTWEPAARALAAVPDGEVDTLQGALTAEHAAVYVLGVLGGRTSAAAQRALFAALTQAHAVHRDRRDALTRAIAAAGADPVAAAAGYEVAGPPTSPEGIRATAATVESAVGEQYAALVATAPTGRRTWPAAVVCDAALRAVALGGTPSWFPGAPELAAQAPLG